MYLLWSQDADGDVTTFGVSEDIKTLETYVENHFEGLELGVFPGFTHWSDSNSLLYTQAADMDWWIEPVEVLS